MAKSSKKASPKTEEGAVGIIETSASVGVDIEGVTKLPLAVEGTCECGVDKAFVDNLVNEARAFAGRACEALSSRLDELEGVAAALEDRMTKYDSGGVKYPKDTREYVVKAGETMSQIAKELLSNAGLFGKIAMWNYDRYPSLRADSNKVDEGWSLRIPPE